MWTSLEADRALGSTLGIVSAAGCGVDPNETGQSGSELYHGRKTGPGPEGPGKASVEIIVGAWEGTVEAAAGFLTKQSGTSGRRGNRRSWH